MPVTAQCVVVSVVFGLVMVLVFGKISNQGAIRRVKNEIAAALMEVFLFRRDLFQALRAQGNLLWCGCRYFTLAMGPVLVLAVPFAIILGHFNLRLGAGPLSVGDQATVSVTVASGADLRQVSLEADTGVSVVGPVRVPKTNSLFWRVQPNQEGAHVLKLLAVEDGRWVEQAMYSGLQPGQPLGIYLARHEPLTTLLFPNGGGGFSLPPGRIERVELSYPERSYTFAGAELSWISVFLVVSIVAGLVGSRLFGVSV